MALTKPKRRPGFDLGSVIPIPNAPEPWDVRLPGAQVSPDASGRLTPVNLPPEPNGMPPVPSTAQQAEMLGGPPSAAGVTPVQDITGAPPTPLRPGFMPALGRALLKMAPIAGSLLEGAAKGQESPNFLAAAGNTYRSKRMEPLLEMQRYAEAQKAQAEADRQRAASEYDYARAAKTDTETGYIPAEQERESLATNADVQSKRASALLAEARADVERENAKYAGRKNEAEIARSNGAAAEYRARAAMQQELVKAGVPQYTAQKMAWESIRAAADAELGFARAEAEPQRAAAAETNAKASMIRATAIKNRVAQGIGGRINVGNLGQALMKVDSLKQEALFNAGLNELDESDPDRIALEQDFEMAKNAIIQELRNASAQNQPQGGVASEFENWRRQRGQ